MDVPFARDWRTRRVSSSSSIKCLEEADDAGQKIIRRKTVITIGSPPSFSYNNSTTSAEVGETACGRITIQVKNNHDDEVGSIFDYFIRHPDGLREF